MLSTDRIISVNEKRNLQQIVRINGDRSTRTLHVPITQGRPVRPKRPQERDKVAKA